MEQLSRTVSTESTKSFNSARLLSSDTSPISIRKARSSDPDTTSGNVERASISMPPPASKAFPRQFPSRRPSKVSDSGILAGTAFQENFSDLRNGSAIDETDTTPTLEGSRGGSISSAQTLTLPDTAFPHSKSEGDVESNRMSFSSLYSLGSAIYNGTRGLASGTSSVSGSEPEVRMEGPVHGTTTATSSLSITTSSQNGGLGLSPTQYLFQRDQPSHAGLPPTPNIGGTLISTSPQLGQSTRQSQSRRSRSRTTTQRRISGSTAASSSPGSREIRDSIIKKIPRKGIIGVCALESKARSKPARNIFGKLIDDFELIIFGDKIILDEDVENWPVCDFLISFFSEGFPLDKAIAYTRLRKPFCVNDLPMQQVLWDRRLCLRILDKLQVPTPKRVEISRDGGPTLPSAEFAKALYDRTGVRLPGPEDGTGGGNPPPQRVELLDDGDTIRVDGVELSKPFVEKPVSGEDHNINIYFPKKSGGGGRRLFRKINNKSSEKDDSLNVPRSISDPNSSYIYEQFLQVENAEDVKAYTVGPNFCHAETRKSPVVDGLVKRNPSGKEVRYVTRLSKEEAEMASRITEGFGQRVCGFDLLRAGDKSYVIDVNGWSFVKDNESYYEKAASILKEMFEKEIQRKERREGRVTPNNPSEIQERVLDLNEPGPARKNTSGGHRSSLKGIFKSPSMSRLAAHHMPSFSGRHHGAGNATSSPEASMSTTPITSPPSFEKPYAGLTSVPMSQPDLLPPPAVPDEELENNVQASHSDDNIVPVPPPASKAQWKLKGIVSVIRHADRTPKQKHKFTFHTKPFVDLLKGHQEEVLLIGEAALNSVSNAVKQAADEGIEDLNKLRELRVYLSKKGAWPGTKVQIKPMFRKRKKEELPPEMVVDTSPERDRKELEATLSNDLVAPSNETGLPVDWAQKRSDSMSGVTLSRVSAIENNLVLDKLQLIIKWGGEPTHSARYQAQDLGTNFRNDLLLLNREVLDDVSVFSSSERRVTTSAQIFAASFLNQKEFPSDHIEIRKDLLDDSNAAKDEMDKVKKKLKSLLRQGNQAPPQFAWPKEDMPEPYLVVRQVVDLMKFHQNVMNVNYKKIETGAVSSLSAISSPSSESPSTVGPTASSLSQVTTVSAIQPRWCCGEGPELFKERWEKLFKEFGDADKVDPSKISELYDTMKFDALHNRQFLEWVFTPDQSVLEEEAIGDSSSKASSIDTKVKQSPSPTDLKSQGDQKDQPSERANIAQRIGFRRKSEIALTRIIPPTYPHESYFTLYTGVGNAASKATVDARLIKLREMYRLCKVLFDYIGPQEYGIDNSEKLEIGLLTSLPLLKEIVEDLEELQASDSAKSFFYFTKESHIYTLLNCILEGGIKTKIERNAIPELDYLSQIGFELYESQNTTPEDEPSSFNYSIRITLSPGCHAFAPLDVQLDSKHMIGFSPRRSLTAHHDWKEVLETLRAKFHTVKLPKSFVAINLSEKVPDAFGEKTKSNDQDDDIIDNDKDDDTQLPPPALEV
ncbi:hypothetical protein K432DRAFT_341380 [Lepidopterella palustris CBS 459.81]|uniref:Inositol hexakisphosphate and diphosphoinositol-pentakisphosphate kinase n=1 Tax=Lepidopterella palustris CBS 459.81 TaxID=1314670 RepID=A0A8E2EM42_9PEZI|nr:hypothetical protein K432DRAFT_341380 [Lepidopterella palustris CBS 459.81]